MLFLCLHALVPIGLIFLQGDDGTALVFVLMFVARPLGVFTALFKSGYNFKEKLFISWVGLRGAVPIILATYPFVYHLESSQLIFNVVFFMVFISVLVQGTTLGFVARYLGIVQDNE